MSLPLAAHEVVPTATIVNVDADVDMTGADEGAPLVKDTLWCGFGREKNGALDLDSLRINAHSANNNSRRPSDYKRAQYGGADLLPDFDDVDQEHLSPMVRDLAPGTPQPSFWAAPFSFCCGNQGRESDRDYRK